MFIQLLVLVVVFFFISCLSGLGSFMWKDQPFECGVSQLSSARKPFSIVFFMITIIFLLFDVEIMLVFPLLFSSKGEGVIMYSIFFILLFGFMIEWIKGSLQWA